MAGDITSLISGTYVDLTTNQTAGGLKTFTNGVRGFGFTALGTAGGWDRAFSFEGSTGTNRGGFGAFGADNALGYYYIGLAFNSNIARFDGTTSATTLYGALSGTSAAFSGTINSTSAIVVNASGRATSFQDLVRGINTSGDFLLTVEGSAAGTRFTGSTAYASVLGTNTSTDLQFGTNNIVRLTLNSTALTSTVPISGTSLSMIWGVS